MKSRKNGHSKTQRLQETDRLSLLVAVERTLRLQAQAQLAHGQFLTLQQQYLVAHAEEAALKERLRLQYEVSEQGAFDLQSGEIRRESLPGEMVA